MANATGITIDGNYYHVGIKYPELKRSFEIKEGSNSGEAITGRKIRDIKGTFYSYEMTIFSLPGKQSDYDELYEVLSAPVDSHVVILPYGQGTIMFEAAIEEGEDVDKGFEGGVHIWDELSIKFTPMEPQEV